MIYIGLVYGFCHVLKDDWLAGFVVEQPLGSVKYQRNWFYVIAEKRISIVVLDVHIGIIIGI